MVEQRSIIERLVFRLVKKHIAGPTSASALEAVREMNAKGLHTTLTLLNDSVSNIAKARYNTNAYLQLIRQVSRLNLDSAVSIRPVQIGYSVDKSLMYRNLEEIAGAAQENKISLWIEHDSASSMQDQIALYRKLRSQYGNVGVEIQPVHDGAEITLDGGIEPKDRVKVRCRPDGDGKLKQKGAAGMYADYIDLLLSDRAEVSVWERDFDMIRKLTSSNPNYKKNVAFEIPFGYSARKLKQLQQYKLDLSVYVPFGRDWVPYLIGRFAEGRIGHIAVALLDGKDDEHGRKN